MNENIFAAAVKQIIYKPYEASPMPIQQTHFPQEVSNPPLSASIYLAHDDKSNFAS